MGYRLPFPFIILVLLTRFNFINLYPNQSDYLSDTTSSPFTDHWITGMKIDSVLQNQSIFLKFLKEIFKNIFKCFFFVFLVVL